MNLESNLGSTIFIYGPPGVGKTAVGRLLARDLNLDFLDLDEWIVSRLGMPIHEIFDSEGEAGFRRHEQAALGEILLRPGQVVALGGGALLAEESRRLAEATGPVVCLQASEEVLDARLRSGKDVRPLLAGDASSQLGGLLAARRDHYASFGLQIDTGELSEPQTAWEAAVRLGWFHIRGMGDGYDVRVVDGGLNRLGEALMARELRGPVALISDHQVGALYGAAVAESLVMAGYQVQPAFFPPGEASKQVEMVRTLWDAFLAAGLERGSTILGLGGGVVGDLAGFAAATYLRGVSWAAAPTSLLAMVDASLGGKTGVDLPQGKNLVGAFHPPRVVWADPEALATLPVEELISGMAEVVKHGILGDPALFDLCLQGWDALNDDWSAVVRRAMAVKIKIIQDDPFEKGARQALNLGHTIGHAVELASGFELRHGEAIAIGLVAETRLAERLGIAEAGLARQIEAVLRQLDLPTETPPTLDWEMVSQAIELDKKKSGGRVRFALPRRIGEVEVGVAVEDLAGVVEGL